MYIINYDYHKLLEEFNKISKRLWIKGVNQLTNSAGITLEQLLGKKSDSMYFPDYKGIEIKCTQRFSNFLLNLFSLAFDGPMLYQMNTILQKYGKQDIIYRDKKILMAILSCSKTTLLNNNYYFKLSISYEEEKLYFEVFDKNHKLIEKGAYINFSTIKSRLELKLSMLAIIWASKRKKDNELYFRYYKIGIYKLISFEKFIQLLQDDIVQVDIIGRVSRSGIEAGRQLNRNLVFRIKKDDINKLFDTIEICDKDYESNFQII